MTRWFRTCSGVLTVWILVGLQGASSLAQAPPPPPVPPSDPLAPRRDPLTPQRGPIAPAEPEIEVLTRGPLHEAFLIEPQLNPEPTPVIKHTPPEPIDELVPEIRPDDPTAIWIGGYWHFDPEESDFLWISGVWRIPPPGHTWVPGVWQPVAGGFQWLCGLWVPEDTGELVYLDPPPESLERGPASPAPDDNHYYVCGAWEMSQGRYRWRAGYWAPIQAGWIWVPSHYVWAGGRVVYVNGYWDREIEARGYPFAWVRVRGRGTVRYRPEVYLPGESLKYHLFVRAGVPFYYYGDYYGAQYTRIGYTPWYRATAVAPLPVVSYYRWSYRRTGVDMNERLGGWTTYFERNVDRRPPTNYAAQIALRNTLRAEDHIRNIAVPAQKASDRLVEAGGQVRRVTQREAEQIRDRSQRWTDFSKDRVQQSSGIVRDQSQKVVDRVKLPNIPGPVGGDGRQGGGGVKSFVPQRPEVRNFLPGNNNSGGRRFGRRN